MKDGRIKNALVTGAAKRVGRELATALAAAGWNVAVHHNSSAPEEALEDIRAQGVKAVALKADLNNISEVRNLIPAANGALGEITLLVNNASIFEKAVFNETSEDIYERHMNLHVKVPLFLSQQFANQCNNGDIININDAYSFRNQSKRFAYLLSKKALRGLSLMLAAELAPNIRVNSIFPGAVEEYSANVDQEFLKKRIGQLPMGKLGNITQIKSALLYLVDSGLTGQEIFIDGGEHLI